MSGPLEGVRVIDVTAHLAGPFCTMQLGDMGAEVIKIEPPSGDYSRITAVPEAKGQAPYFLSINRNKKGMFLNLKEEGALKALYGLVEKSDVFVENYRPGVTKNLKIDYETLKEINPKLVYASVSGFGQKGPKRYRPSFDIVGQSESGIMHLTGARTPGNFPVHVAGSIGDTIPGLYATVAILGALYYARETGIGQSIDVSQVHSVTAVIPLPIQSYLITKVEREMVERTFPLRSLRETFQSKDGFVSLATHFQFMEILVKVLSKDIPEILDEWTENMTLSEKAYNMLVDWMKSKTNNELDELLTAARIPYGIVQKPSDLLDDPQNIARGVFVDVDHSLGFSYKTISSPMLFSETPAKIYRAPPLFNQDTKAILSEILGYSEEEIANLRKAGAIV